MSFRSMVITGLVILAVISGCKKSAPVKSETDTPILKSSKRGIAFDLAFHWYDYGLSAQLDRLIKYNKQIWFTEMANWNS